MAVATQRLVHLGSGRGLGLVRLRWPWTARTRLFGLHEGLSLSWTLTAAVLPACLQLDPGVGRSVVCCRLVGT